MNPRRTACRNRARDEAGPTDALRSLARTALMNPPLPFPVEAPAEVVLLIHQDGARTSVTPFRCMAGALDYVMTNLPQFLPLDAPRKAQEISSALSQDEHLHITTCTVR